MGWRFRKSFSPIPGVRLTISPSGVTTSIGAGPFRITHGARGTAATINGLGSGLSYRHQLSTPPSKNSRQSFLPEPSPSPYQIPSLHAQAAEMSNIESAGSSVLTTQGLTEFQRVIQHTRQESYKIKQELRAANLTEKELGRTSSNWSNSWLKKRLFKKRFAEILAKYEEAKDRTAELTEQEILTKVQTEIDLPDTVRTSFSRMSDEFALMARSQKIWDTTSERATNKIAERTSASRMVTREEVTFKLSSCELIDSAWRVPYLANANGGDLFLYPGFVLYFVSADAFALLEINDLKIEFSTTSFQEDEVAPRDSKQVSRTWAKVNKDGSPDRRFNDNYEIPVMEYFKLTLSSKTGLNEEYLISNVDAALRFSQAWEQFISTIAQPTL